MRTGFVILAALVICSGPALADTFTYLDQKGDTQTAEARLVAEKEGVLLLGLPDGEYKLIPQEAVKERKPGKDPTPLTAEQVAKNLETRFTAERFRSHIQDPYVMGLVLTAPLPKNADIRAKNFLRRAATFMKNVDAAFGAFAKEARLEVRNPVYPLVVLIFETDAEFEEYMKEVTGGGGVSARSISGFYSGLTNFLAIRMGECTTFDVPLHEAIHQQVYNRNVFHRLSDVPHWFDEGIATGFESLEGKVNIGPTKISPRYARLERALPKDLSWSSLMDNDSAFGGDVLIGHAYAHAWSLHWLMVTKYRTEYQKYIRVLATKMPLEKDKPEQRQKDFSDAFGKTVADMQKEFQNALDAGLKRQKVDLAPKESVGYLTIQQNAGEAQMYAVDSFASVQMKGTLKNLSPLRTMTYLVTAETDGGSYAEWLVPNLDVAKNANLDVKAADKRMRHAPGGGSGRFRVRIRSAPSGSSEADAWIGGNVPVPTYGER